jgi:hypothetical protein
METQVRGMQTWTGLADPYNNLDPSDGLDAFDKDLENDVNCHLCKLGSPYGLLDATNIRNP